MTEPASHGTGRPGRQLPVVVAATAVATALVVGLFAVGWEGKPTSSYVSGVAVGFVAVTAVSRRTVARAREVAGPQPLTAATWVTLARGWLLIAFAGFLLTDAPGAAGAWVPAGLFGAAAALDAVDGAVARRTGTVSELGERLDTEIDALLVLAGATAAVLDGSASVLFLGVGSARYAFVAGIRLRQARGRPVTDLHPSQVRRATGAMVLATTFLALAPAPGATVSWWLTAIVSVPALLSFGWDWLAVSGRIDR